jgi:hypothetical protein
MNSITTERDCYAAQQEILVTFTNCLPNADDWVGLYEYSSDDDSSLLDEDPLLWSWSCGTQNCGSAFRNNTFLLGSQHTPQAGGNGWPLERTEYKVYLIRRDAGAIGYNSYAESEMFEVNRNGRGC